MSYICNSCQKQYKKWLGKCESCGEWNTIVEDESEASFLRKPSNTKKSKTSKPIEPVRFAEIGKDIKLGEIKTGLSEFDNAIGGNLIAGQVILLAGSPGIGKSTLSLQVTEGISSQGLSVLYIAGEESPEQVKRRADRLGLAQHNVDFLQETNIERIENYIANNSAKYRVVIVDSIQTLYSQNITSSSGSISQVSECADKIVNLSKGFGIISILIGHITKSGNIAGPKILEHMVDTVLHFEGDKQHEVRILRVEKNRFGSTDEVGIFKMLENGLSQVNDTSELFEARSAPEIGTAFSMVMEGKRPVIVEVQALAVKSYFEIPRRTTSGFDLSRLNILLALVDKKLKLKAYEFDIYVNITGGIKVKDPAVDLAVLKSIISSIKNEPVSNTDLYFGEVGLTGEIRKVIYEEKRIKEARRLGFKNIISSSNFKNIINI